MAEDQLEARQATIDNLSAFIETSQSQLDCFLGELNWNREELLNEKRMKVCPVNSHHVVPESSLKKHTEECELVAEGYTREEQKEIQSTHFFYSQSNCVVPVLIDNNTQKEILSKVPGSFADKKVPRTVERMDKTFTSAERLAIYDTIIEKSKATNRQSAISLQELELDPDSLLKRDQIQVKKSKLEVLAELRDYKRRRQSYRAKNVHITRRSQTEIMRDVIENQMTEIRQAIQGDDESSVQTSERADPSPIQTLSRSREVSPSPDHPRSREHSRQREESLGHRNSRRGSLDEDSYSRRSRRSPRRSHSGRKDDRRDRRRDSHHSEVTEKPHIKVEKDLTRSHEAGDSPEHSQSKRVKERDIEDSSAPSPEIRIKVEKDEEPRSGNSSRSSSTSRKEHKHKHSKHKHHHKHKHHR
ncbi:U11/U12 small nuclear ribonucleoprotein 48 kDa protein-like [Asterias rubens]|uniref:U11/U12 small nuclear ribonucleoprotein 48 kDa protein-like n=1 Tax=Asterias rubens TaxID=7604 RepID=UPI001455BC7E|nr:U11/U12 small nuclear ribonucleoprotein 48 kDa protein-like [Asterias rubens]